MIGIRTINMYGFAKQITNSVPITLKPKSNTSFIFVGIIRSISSISFENLLMILPRGVVSKNAIVEDKMWVSISLWSFIEALNVPIVMIITASNTEVDCNNPKTKMWEVCS